MKWMKETPKNKNIYDMTKLELIDNIKRLEREKNKLLDEKEELKQEVFICNHILEIGRQREYHSKFLKDFQKEKGKNVWPDHDEIYKRYDNYKSKVDQAIEYIKENSYMARDKEINGIPLMSKRLDKCDDLLEILGDKDENN